MADILAKSGCEGAFGVQYYRIPSKGVWDALYADSGRNLAQEG